MINAQLDLVYLTVTPEEARMLATAAAKEGIRTAAEGRIYSDKQRVYAKVANDYRDLSAKVDRQRQL